jgi:hypothetical protein
MVCRLTCMLKVISEIYVYNIGNYIGYYIRYNIVVFSFDIEEKSSIPSNNRFSILGRSKTTLLAILRY